MGAAYRDLDVRLEGETLRVRFAAENTSPAPWDAQQGFAFGYHVFDAGTGTLIEEGPRLPPQHAVAPGQATRAAFEIPLPEGPERYRILVSPMREGVCWYYERGWPFLAIDCAGGRLESARVTTRAALRRAGLWRSLWRALVYPVRSVAANRSLIRTMVRRDVLGRYRGSYGGAFWTVLNPLLLMATYFFVFGVVLRTRFGGDPSRSGFALYFLAGMLPWLAFSEAAGRAPTVMLEHRNFVKKLVFAIETLPVNLVVSGLVSEAFGLLIFTLAFLLARGGVPLSVLWLPALLIPQVLFTAGVCWFFAALGVFVRDLGQIIGFLLTLWFFLTPICYPEASLPPAAVPVLSQNPMFVLVRGYRAVFLEGQAPAFSSLWKLWLVSAAVFVLGHAWFYKLRRSFADIL